MKKLLPIALALVLAAGIYGYRRSAQAPVPAAVALAPPPASAPGVPVEVRRVEPGNLSRELTVVGSLRSNESVMLRPEVAGRIAQIAFAEGTPVRRGAVLVILDDSVNRAEMAQAEASLSRSRRLRDSGRQLFGDRYISDTEMDQLETAVKVDEAALALAQARLQKTRLLAPFDGVLGLRRVSVGDYVEEGQDIVNLEDITPIKLDFRIPEGRLSELQPGLPLDVQVDAYAGEAFAGQVTAIDPQVGAGDRSIAVRGEVANDDGRLRPGLFARVRLVLERRSDAITIPEQAVVPQGERHFVFRVVEGKARLTEVRLGQRLAGRVEVLEGLAAGEQIVIAGLQKLKDGAPVSVLETPAAAAAADAPH